ncbi:hypothetical protein UA08_09450 [Talaromyces atroroseus]|uniref:Protein kinase domain-containing protein n=1 Tax=Talaromyces atroroseus TaxID=1441469 RepID=A0A225A555_TALAT|nr:hypothetical protein UA08_09450 [Talaromyces atroroseus]OKL55282.1 hypothetical protein UA08_09450 [Talaromyces atroroseus]
MHLRKHRFFDFDPSNIQIIRELGRSDASSIFEVELNGEKYAMKLFHDNGDPGYTKKGRDLNRFRCELNAYNNLEKFGVCELGFVPYFYGHIDRVDPVAFQPALRHFAHDKFKPRAIILEYLPNAEKLDCENYSDARYRNAIHGMKQIHKALVHHQDIYPKNVLVVPGQPERVVWVDFDVATTFSSMGNREQAYCEYEDELVSSFGEALVRSLNFILASGY